MHGFNKTQKLLRHAKCFNNNLYYVKIVVTNQDHYFRNYRDAGLKLMPENIQGVSRVIICSVEFQMLFKASGLFYLQYFLKEFWMSRTRHT